MSTSVDATTITWLIERAFASLDRRARVIETLINDHRNEFGRNIAEPSIDAICISMATLTVIAKYRFENEVGQRYPEQFRRLLVEYCRQSFTDRVSIPELHWTAQHAAFPASRF